MPVRFEVAMRQVCPMGFWRNLNVLSQMVEEEDPLWGEILEDYGERYCLMGFLGDMAENDEGIESLMETEGMACVALLHVMAMIWTAEGKCGEEDDFECDEEDCGDDGSAWDFSAN